MTQVTNIPVAQIIPGNNDRKTFDPAKLAELAASIQANSLAQPITVRPIGSNLFGETTYQIVAGERRFRAISQVLKLDTAPCLIRELSDSEASAIMLAENTGRVDLNPIEEAAAYSSRMAVYHSTIEQVAQVAGVSADLVKRRLSLLKLNDDIRHLVAGGHFPIGHAEAIADLDPNRQRIATRIFRESKNGLPLAAFRSVVSQLLEEQSQDSLFDLEAFWVTQVQVMADLPTRGKRAVTGAPVRTDLPAVTVGGSKDTTAAIVDRFIADLLAGGFEAEAGAIGTLYTTLVRANFLSVPQQSRLLGA